MTTNTSEEKEHKFVTTYDAFIPVGNGNGYLVNEYGIFKDNKSGASITPTASLHGPVITRSNGETEYVTDLLIDAFISPLRRTSPLFNKMLTQASTRWCGCYSTTFPFKYFTLQNIPRCAPINKSNSIDSITYVPLHSFRIVTPYQYAKVRYPEYIYESDTKGVYYCRLDSKWYVDIKTPDEDIFIEDRFDTEEQAIGYLEYHTRTNRKKLLY